MTHNSPPFYGARRESGAMSKANVNDKAKFKVVCSWCSCVIRRAAANHSQGMCQQCFTKMFEEMNRRARAQGGTPLRASER